MPHINAQTNAKMGGVQNKMERRFFSRPEHFYPKGRHEPVTQKEIEGLFHRAQVSRTSLILLAIILCLSVLYFVSLILYSIGFSAKAVLLTLSLCFGFLVFVLYIIFSGEKASNLVSGKI